MAGPVRVRISRHFATTRNRQAPARDGGESSGLGRRQLVARVDDEAVVREPLPVRLARAGVRVRQLLARCQAAKLHFPNKSLLSK